MILPFVIADRDAVAAGYRPGALAMPTGDRSKVFVMGIVSDKSRVEISKDCFVTTPRGLRPAVGKAYSYAGPLATFDMRRPTARIYLEKYLGAYGSEIAGRSGSGGVRAEDGGNRAAEMVTKAFDTVLSSLVADCRSVLGEDLLTGVDMPMDFRVVNMALELVALGKRDQARLVLQWPMLTENFRQDMSILDRAVSGETLWSALSPVFSEATIKEIKRFRNVSEGWVPAGASAKDYFDRLAKAAAQLPVGVPRPTCAEESRYLLAAEEFCSGAFAYLPANVASAMSDRMMARTKYWKDGGQYWSARDYVAFIYDEFVVPGFELDGELPSGSRQMEALVSLTGDSIEKLSSLGELWHADMDNYGTSSTRGTITLAPSWPSAIETLAVPTFRAADGREIGGISIVPLDTREALTAEGSRQRHCVASRQRACCEGRERVVSVRIGGQDDLKTLSTASLVVRDGLITVVEHRAFANRKTCEIADYAMGWFESQANLSRPPFSVNKVWPEVRPHDEDFGRGSRLDALARLYGRCRPILSKRVREGGFEAFQKVFAA